jgi:hypothetical protein
LRLDGLRRIDQPVQVRMAGQGVVVLEVKLRRTAVDVSSIVPDRRAI